MKSNVESDNISAGERSLEQHIPDFRQYYGGVSFSAPKPNVRIYITDDFSIYSTRKKPFNRFQVWMMWTCFGWKVKVIE